MKEIKKYKLSILKLGLFKFTDHVFVNEHTEFVKYSDVEQLQARIKELESEKHINEIKAQGIADYLENDLLQYVNSYDANYGVSLDHIESEIKKLRAKHE